MILWDVRRGEKIYQFLEHGPITDLAFHPEGKSFFSTSSTGDLIRWELHPEIFVLHYFEEAYLKDLEAEADLEPRRKGESKKDYQNRQVHAAPLKENIVDRYYQLYLQERDQ
jgi:WD40 repeat protein